MLWDIIKHYKDILNDDIRCVYDVVAFICKTRS